MNQGQALFLLPFSSLTLCHSVITMAQPVRTVDRRFTTTAFTYPGYQIAASHGVVRGQVLSKRT